ncbi:hypothetical protein M409DRAFT_20543 [Zasmidium cellare ATCC 36951]|uniref:serine--tRNA ligase n=1 Tax=Zasmidium cellare ATCC 36951 TaxID=1080233 RepID=A0A6A6CT04_ZASCE|nr:uncharacterized protein M409DRAFT_20543 [Zasmidium cellare ATCC 36951]KAF2169318.1 hypothetical protein M409DRAFT_20543 [Zasmidium cellare ATCC 36951]
MNASYICLACRRSARSITANVSSKRRYTRPSFAPKPVLDLKHIRQNPGLYEQNCIDRNYNEQAKNGWRILELHESLVEKQKHVIQARQRSNAIGKEVGKQAAAGAGKKETLLDEARKLKELLSAFEDTEKEIQDDMEKLASELPNLSSHHTPVGKESQVIEVINEDLDISRSMLSKSHVDIGKELDIIDFEASATTSGWGWYFLKNEGALLEQALIQYALSVAMKRGWKVMTPPSLVYSHIANACGFMPRDQHGETQIYGVAQIEHDRTSDKPGLVLAGTAEIPFAGSQASKTLKAEDLPLKVIGPSRSYRAEAGARGVDTKGLYRVHEFTKVEMFAWTLPATNSEGDRFGDDEQLPQTEDVFTEVLDIQKEILTSLNLHAKVLEMPSSDLGASATRKIDMEAFFPSRQSIEDGYGEVTSASICTDYQSRRLNTRLKMPGSAAKLGWPHTVNGTAMAIPRILACILENHWKEDQGAVQVPECLRAYMPGNVASIERRTAAA